MPTIGSFLIINPFGIGDVLFSTPLIRSVHEQYPDARIFYLCNKKTAPVLRNHPLLQRLFVYERDEFVAAQKASIFGGLRMYADFISGIRAQKIDVCLDLSLNTPFGFFAWAAGIPQRYGLDYKNRGIFLNHRVPIPGFCSKHVAEYYLDVARLAGIRVRDPRMEVYTDANAHDWATTFLAGHAIGPAETIVGIAPCGGDAFGKDAHVKRWPAQNYSALIGRLTGSAKTTVFLFGGPKENEDIRRIMAASGSPAVFEFTDASLEQTIALIKRCDCFIGNDTGPVRFADALQKRTIVLFGPVDERVYGLYPYEEGRTVVLKKNMPCRPCYRQFRLHPCVRSRECLTGITVDDVWSAYRSLMKVA